MIILGPTAAIVTPASNVATSPQPTVYGISFDLVNHTFSIVYGDTGTTRRQVTGAIPGALQTAIETHCQRQIENDQGWAANSSSVVQP